jgi:hypothetical protein
VTGTNGKTSTKEMSANPAPVTASPPPAPTSTPRACRRPSSRRRKAPTPRGQAGANLPEIRAREIIEPSLVPVATRQGHSVRLARGCGGGPALTDGVLLAIVGLEPPPWPRCLPPGADGADRGPEG